MTPFSAGPAERRLVARLPPECRPLSAISVGLVGTAPSGIALAEHLIRAAAHRDAPSRRARWFVMLLVSGGTGAGRVLFTARSEAAGPIGGHLGAGAAGGHGAPAPVAGPAAAEEQQAAVLGGAFADPAGERVAEQVDGVAGHAGDRGRGRGRVTAGPQLAVVGFQPGARRGAPGPVVDDGQVARAGRLAG